MTRSNGSYRSSWAQTGRRRVAVLAVASLATATGLAVGAAPANAGGDDGDPLPGIVSSQPTSTNVYARTPVADDYGVARGTLGGGVFVRDTGTTVGGNEPSIAINPANPNEIAISSFNGCFTCNAGGTDLQFSSDGGNTWTDENVIPAPPPGTGNLSVGPRDQTFDYGRNDTLYGTILVGPNSNLDVYSGSTTDPTSATAWQWNTTGNPATAVRTNSAGIGQVDQPWLLVNSDPTTPAQDDTYVAYDDDSGTGDVRVAAAQGTAPPNFTSDVKIGSANGAGGSGPYNQGLRLGIDQLSGSTYAIWQKGNGAGASPNSTKIGYMLNRTRDGGSTWSLNGNSLGVQIAQGDSTQVTPKFCTVNSLRGGVDHVAVDPNNGDVYAVYGNQDPTTHNMRLSITRLVNDASGNLSQAAPFSSGPVFVTGQVNAAMPSVAVAANGVVGVLYDTCDGFSSTGFPIFTAHLAQSADHGVTWTDQVLETFLSPQTDPGPSVDTQQNQRVLGDYQQLKAVDNTFYGTFPGNGAPFGATQSIINPIFFKSFAGGPQAAVTGNLNFGIVPRGTVQNRSVTIQNTGTDPLVVNGVSLKAGSDPAFSVESTPGTPRTVQPGGSLVYNVDFAPPSNSDATPRTATLDIETNDPGQPSITAAITGTPGVPGAVLSPKGKILFAQTCAGSSNQQELSVTNSGYADLTITGVTITGPDAGQFSIDNAPPPNIVIRPGSYYDLIVQFNPTSGGPKSATVTVTTDDPATPTISVSLSATGEVSQLVIGANSIGFGGVPVDDRTSPHTNSQTLVLSNQSDCPLSITSLTFGGVNPADFALVGPPTLPFTIGAHNEVDLTARFNPSATGSRSGTLAVGSSDPINPSQVVAFDGEGLTPVVTVTPAGTIIFAPTVVEPVAGGTGGSTQTLTVTNSGQAELIVDTMSTSGAPWFAPGATSPPQRYAVNGSFTEPVTFHPSGTPTRKVTGTLTITDNGLAPPVSTTVPLCGEAVGRGIRVLVIDRSGNIYNGLTKGKLQTYGLQSNVNINLKSQPLTTINPPTTCQRVQYDYENQNLPAAYTVNQRQAYYVLSVFEGNKQTNFTFTLLPNEFKLILLTI